MQPDYLKLLAQFDQEFSPISRNQSVTENQLIEADNILELLGEDIIWHETTPATNPLNKNLPSDLPTRLVSRLQGRLALFDLNNITLVDHEIAVKMGLPLRIVESV